MILIYKKLKNYKLILLILLFASLTGCKKWLDVNPSTQISENEQFTSQQGFIDVLFGTYQKMSGESAYGHLGTYGFIDVLAQSYENKSSQTTNWYGETARYNYTSESGTQQNVRGAIKSIWSEYYSTISQANFILKNVDATKVLSEKDYNIIKGEALALRAFIHFDLLRMFAPAYLDGANAGVNAIPYMEEFTVNPQAKLPISTVLDKCEADLKTAEDLLSVYPDIDQIADNQSSTSLELFLMCRQNHLNYWAVKAALARLYLYKGDKVNASKYALEVINSGQFTFISPGSLSVDATSVNSDLTFSSEHIFSLNVSSLKTSADLYFKSSQISDADANDLYSTKAKLTAMYETSTVGYGTDIRNPDASKSLWSQLTTSIVYSKKYYSDNSSNVKQRLIPIIRLPEMYYIAAESVGSVSDGVDYLNVVREARLLPDLDATVINTPELLDAEIQKEVRKELYGEGQLWFYYKRKDVASIPDGVGNPMSQEKYTFPYPLDEIEFGLE